ncbi:hypothetical protein PF005_g12094 [Phytophthora fragariae]|uniref:DDE-1 domain-containing protein n=1 Tax=Phytophthora fragariae TaxID=53985 RepID=A0A6A3Y2J5_9STRA|nr:hypothetical protein PF011_g10719 [Phytophthora fragariae]KAE9208737.1 hypothetical protein PF005_g12094 [Phytophthora fragariae]KAE9228131.1 hypothetical protein PF004_g11153 [Phytophthora fragariae]KAE9228317.1 hypothetical protein PF002_g13573 [Phytophthora fragariae]
MTAVLTIRADGMKMPILFIVRGKVGGRIEASEFDDYPDGHFYTLQENAWMDATRWRFYVEKLMMYKIDGPAVVLLDNFDASSS